VTHTFTVTVQQNLGDGAGYVAATNGHVVATLTGSNGITAADITIDPSSTCDTTGSGSGNNLSAAGTCTVVFKSLKTGKVTGNATVTIPKAVFGTQNDVVRDTDPATASIGAGTGGSETPAVKTYVDAFITITQVRPQNNMGEEHTFTVTVKKDVGDGAGFVPATNGHVIVTMAGDGVGILNSDIIFDDANTTCEHSFSLPGNPPPSAPNNLDANGQCVVVFTSPKAGTVTGHATVGIPKSEFGTQLASDVVRQTDGVGNNSGDVVKEFLAGSIAWKKVDNAGRLQAGATFTICQTKVFIGGVPTPITCVPFDVVDNSPPDIDPADGQFKVTGLALGEYTVTEKIAPPGYIPDPNPQTVDLLPPPGSANVNIEKAFVNSRPILKITGFGYTNSPLGALKDGILHGQVIYTVNLHNYGTADAVLDSSSLKVTAPASANVVCTGAGVVNNELALTGTIGHSPNNADGGPYTMTCEYNANDGDGVTATLNVNTLTNGLPRAASGSPAVITYTVQGD